MKIKLQTSGISRETEIISYRKISEPENLILSIDGEMTQEDNTKNAMKEFFKVQFIASCKVQYQDAEILSAFVLGMYGEIVAHVIDSEYSSGAVELIDYQGYRDICNITGEKILSFKEYITERYDTCLNYLEF